MDNIFFIILSLLSILPCCSLPPTVLPDNSPQVQVSNSKIKIAPNLFSNPNNSAGTEEPTINTLRPQDPANTEDQIERILVRRYIKKATE